MKYYAVLVCFVITAMSFFSFQKAPLDMKGSITRGKEIYGTHCQSCHMEAGEGLEGVYPPVAKSDYLMADKTRSIKVVMFGAFEEMKVNGTLYNTEMAAVELNDQQVSDVLNYVRNSFGNKGPAVTVEEVKALRK